MKKKVLLSLILSSLIATAASAKDNTSQFKEAYAQYQQAEEVSDLKALQKYAKESFELGQLVFGLESINTINLSINYAKALFAAQKHEQSAEVLMSMLPTIEKVLKPTDLALVDVYLTLSDSLYGESNDKSEKYLLKALRVTSDNEHTQPVLAADLEVEIGRRLVSFGSTKSRILVHANKVLSEHLPENDRRLIYSNYYLGKYYLSHRKLSKAIESFSKNLPVFEKLNGPTHQIELATHALLIDAYEKKGNREQATQHCVAIGQLKPWAPEQEQQPIYRTAPEYPMSAARRGENGMVKMAFTVTPMGFVEDIEVIKSEGSKSFHAKAKEAIQKWRYAPKFEDGKPVAAKSTVQIDFKLGK
jgi:TonB family protein